MIVVAALPASSPSATVDLSVDGLRSGNGSLRVCLTAAADQFPDCRDDPASRRVTVPASHPQIVFGDLASGNYAVSVIHDENGNGRLDTFAGVPREGVGFSRNPRLMFGPPRFSAARFAVTNSAVEARVRMRYFL